MNNNNLIMCDYNKGILDGLSEAVLEFAHFNEHGFEYLDVCTNKYGLIVKLEYTGDDIIYKSEEYFNDQNSYRDFCDKMGDIVIDKGLVLKKKMEEIIKEYSLSIKLTNFEWDEYDYPCIYLTFEPKLK